MKIIISNNSFELGQSAALVASELIKTAITKNGQANIILATGTSQFEVLNQLTKEIIDWSKVVLFHLDEYIGLPASSPASFRKYLTERFIEKVSPFKACHLVNGETDPHQECMRLGELIERNPVDVALVGIGENGHLGFNDPPADFDTTQAFIVVTLDEKCRKQQLGEGWFTTLEEVPRKAITMSIQQIMKSTHIICSVPDSRKAVAVRDCLESPVSDIYPASILQLHKHCSCFLDKESSSLLKRIKIKPV